jgi:hypothetical protein
VLVLQDGDRLNSPRDCYISVVISPRKCSSPGWPLRGFYDVTGTTQKGWQRGEKVVTVFEEMVGRTRFWELGIKKIAQNCKLKMITGERAISNTWQ